MERELTVVIGAGRFPDGAPEIKIRGGVEDSLIPSLVMEASIKRYSPDTKVINTYHMQKPKMSRRKNPTPFSLVRFMVPALCGYEGWGAYCDADQIVFDDICNMFRAVERDPGHAAYVAKAHGCTGVTLMDASKLKGWDAHDVCDKIDKGADYGRMMRELNGVGFSNLGDLGEEWNTRDRFSNETKLLHFTSLATQPWKFPGKHPCEHLWAAQLRLAIDEGYIHDENLDANCRKILEALEAAAR